MKLRTHRKPRGRGFALVVTLSLMILLTVIAVGLLSLSAISLRSSSAGEADARAFANARMAVMMAIGDLQKELGDDRRITADASILLPAAVPSANGQPQPQQQLVGAWTSWSPSLSAKPDGTAPDYIAPKASLFRSWLVSAPDPGTLKNRDWANTVVDPADPKRSRLFSLDKDGFDLTAARVPMLRGGIAWAVSQENTKAKVNVAGPDVDASVNLALHAQRRPSLASSGILKQPANGWNLRSDRLLSFKQIGLDSDLTAQPDQVSTAGTSFTVHSQGLLTDVVKGGLKTDLNLGFELSDAEFAKSAWDDVPNPFRSSASRDEFASPASYLEQRALFRPLVENPIVSSSREYGDSKLTLVVENRFFAASVPTFDHLRSFYRIPYHLYGGSSPTVAERGPDHVAVKISPAGGGGAYFSPANPPQGNDSKLAIRPVLNRLVYLLSVGLTRKGDVGIVLTPIVSLWNPYNTALEIEGAVAYPWMDMPFNLRWKIVTASGSSSNWPLVNMSMMMSKQFADNEHGRSINPYFFCELTGEGDGNLNTPIRFEPGEVRVFAPVSNTPIDFIRLGSNRERTIRLRPVNDIDQLNRQGGFTISMTGGVKTGGTAHGFPSTYKIKPTDKIYLTLEPSKPDSLSDPEGYHYFVALEDAARIKDNGDSTRGEAVTEVQVLGFQAKVTNITAPTMQGSSLSVKPQAFAVMETFHRTALASGGERPNADLVYTTNPRHASINRDLSSGSFNVAPHFESSLVAKATFDDAIQVSFDGRRSYWGPAHDSAIGKDYLPFFEIPREPLLSLAAFQHADLAASTYSSANQFANSWASPYLALEKTASINDQYTNKPGVPVYDTPYLANETLWDGFFFSGAAPVLKPAATGKPGTAWDSPIANVERTLDAVVRDFVADPLGKPLGNSRMRLRKGGLADDALVQRLLDPAGCARIAAHLTVDGAFNINSTDVGAWIALLSGLRGEAFEVEGGTPPAGDLSAFPRFRHPTGKTDDNWNGFRALSDAQIRTLAENLVKEIRSRGPFLSLAEFVNRRVEDSDLGKSGAIQAAIDAADLNEAAKQEEFEVGEYPAEAKDHIIKDTGVGIPGYLTQADVLQSLAPVITCRSDTFTVRGYGEAKDTAGKVIARSWCEAVVQRTPDFVDPSNAAETAIASLTSVNSTFGRRFEIVSFRRIPSSEIQ